MATRIPLPAGWGEAWLHEPGAHQRDVAETARSYDHRGRQLVWWPPVAAVCDRRSVDAVNQPDRRSQTAATDGARFACDIEDGSRACADMAARFGVGEREFRRRWVVAEVLAKLHAVPILAWLKQHGLAAKDDGGVRVWVREWAATGGVMAFGMLRETGKD